MRRLKYLLLAFVVLVSINAQAQNETKISDERIEDLSKRMCIAALTFRVSSSKQAGDRIERLILNFLGSSKEDKNHKAIITKFWNENYEKFICYDEGTTERTRNPQQFMKRIVDLGMYKSVLYNFLLSDEDEYPIDVNAVEIYNGKEETLLDYLDGIISNPEKAKEYNIKEIKLLRLTIIEDYNAKIASELKN
ncbi:MAG: hypothetical protein V7719_15640 [Psychroserpens sp.]|uniref:hypothetical protein n=1 Tax=Psychroserpens sp. TaxID=2020870 RepID=UPI00300159C2